MKITRENLNEVWGEILQRVANGCPPYFTIAYWEFSDVYTLHFTPLVGKTLFVEDYLKLIVILLTHPKVSDVEWDREKNMITAMFEVPEGYMILIDDEG